MYSYFRTIYTGENKLRLKQVSNINVSVYLKGNDRITPSLQSIRSV